MKLLVVNSNRMKTDGMTKVITNLYTYMDKNQICVDVVAINTPPEAVSDLFLNHGGKIFVLDSRLNRPLQYLKNLKKIMMENKYDLIHVHTNSAIAAIELLAAWSAGCKVRIAHSHNTTCKNKVFHYMLKPLFRMLCTHCLACGEAAGKWLYGKRDFQVVRNGIDTKKYAFSQEKRMAIRKAYQIPENRKIIGHVGAFNQAKNQKFLIDILKRLQNLGEDYGAILIGDGQTRQNIELQVQQLGLQERVLFVGNTEQVSDYLSACDLFVMPSIYEGFPLSLVEAQANGLQCIVSDTVTTESNLAGNLSFLNLGAGPDSWAPIIVQMGDCTGRAERSKVAIEQIKEHNYDIYTEAEALKQYYTQAMRGVK